jgi:RNA polymerase sigma factor (sigma-70 family)
VDNYEYARKVSLQLANRLPLGSAIPMDTDDCVQLGFVGLLQAAARFDISGHDPEIASLNTNFRSYAYRRIRGAILDECRRQTFVRRRGLEKGIRFQMMSLDQSRETEDGDSIQWELSFEEDPSLRIDFENALEDLTEREKIVILNMMAGITGRELALKIGVTESRISQIAADARAKLSEALAG